MRIAGSGNAGMGNATWAPKAKKPGLSSGGMPSLSARMGNSLFQDLLNPHHAIKEESHHASHHHNQQQQLHAQGLGIAQMRSQLQSHMNPTPIREGLQSQMNPAPIMENIHSQMHPSLNMNRGDLNDFSALEPTPIREDLNLNLDATPLREELSLGFDPTPMKNDFLSNSNAAAAPSSNGSISHSLKNDNGNQGASKTDEVNEDDLEWMLQLPIMEMQPDGGVYFMK